jgi:hypothetical protein
MLMRKPAGAIWNDPFADASLASRRAMHAGRVAVIGGKR